MTRACQAVDGVVLLDKPSGMTSNRALQQVKRAFGACKAGHTGSLDPLASGLLPICLGEATKLAQFLLDADKRYLATVRLGIETDTYDSEGAIVARRAVAVTAAQVAAVLPRFSGPIMQVPPSYSALKRDGKPLYAYARAGAPIVPAARAVTVHALEMVELAGDVLTLDVRCSKGTYIRSLAHDIGAALGCGGHIVALRRTASMPFTLAQAHALDAVVAARDASALQGLLVPADRALTALPSIQLTAANASALCRGQQVFVGTEQALGQAPGQAVGPVRLYAENAEFLGIGELGAAGWVAPRRLRANGVNLARA